MRPVTDVGEEQKKTPRNEGIRVKIKTIAQTTVWNDGGGDQTSGCESGSLSWCKRWPLHSHLCARLKNQWQRGRRPGSCYSANSEMRCFDSKGAR
ncbi:hypothetical protein Vi05172_g8327 [Venturia inaequalis]|nr:hypothetical protein Vi05172_g8327 [Venturia inaequalis]